VLDRAAAERVSASSSGKRRSGRAGWRVWRGLPDTQEGAARCSGRAGLARARYRGRVVRSVGSAIEAGKAPCRQRAAGQGRTTPARRGVSRAQARAASFKALAAREARTLAKQGYALAVTGPWPPYTFVQE
jgi:hypothetical protein